MRTIRLIVMLLFVAVAAQAAQKSVQVGYFTLGGTDTYGTVFTWTLDASAITSEPICLGAVTWIVDGVSHTFLASSGGEGFTICTLPLVAPPYPNQYLVLGCDQFTPGCFSLFPTVVLPSCYNGCTNISLQLISTTGKAFSFTLLDGKKFQTYGVNTSSMSPPPGQLYITPGQSAPLILYRDPSGK